MQKLLIVLAIWHISLSHQFSMPNDGQMIDGYGPDFPDHQLDPEEKNEPSLLDGERNKRAIKYKVLESPGLHSHFQIQDEEVLKTNPHRRRTRRGIETRSELHSDEVEDIDTAEPRRDPSDEFSVENLPQAEKQTMNPAYYRSSDDSRVMDKWVKAPYGDFQSRTQKEEEDTQAEASSNVGIKARTPRVNFITQQGQGSGNNNNNKDEPDGPEARERERERERDRDHQSSNGNNNNKQNNDDSYRKPTNDRYYPPSYNTPKNYDNYAPYTPYRERERAPIPQSSYYNPNTYDKYDPYYERDRLYDRSGMIPPPGMGRMGPPNSPSSSFYYRHQYNDYDDYLPRSVPNYYYSDKRFDMPAPNGLQMESRDPYQRDPYRPYLYNNDVNNHRPGRIIYYADLPEIVRTPENSNYRAATSRYGDQMYDYYYNPSNYDREGYRASRTAKASFRDVPASTTMRVASTPVRADTARERQSSYYGK